MSIGMILLTILKVLGLIVLVLLGLILLALLLLLFVPVRYQAEGRFEKTPVMTVRVTWLLRLLSLRAGYDGNKEKKEALQYSLRIFGISVLGHKKAAAFQNGNTKKRKPEGTKAVAAATEPESLTQLPAKESQADDKAQEKPAKLQEADIPKPHSDSAVPKTEERGKNEEEKAGKFSRIAYTIRKVYDKIKQIYGNIAYYLDLLRQESTKEAFSLCKKQLVRILRHICPKKIWADVRFGTGDPASTGQIFGYFCILYPLLGKQRIMLEPDFEQKIIQGEGGFRGRITLCRLLVTALILYFNKNIRKLLKCLQKEECYNG